MSEMVERVAKACFEVTAGSPFELPAGMSDAIARAVIAAMREPTEEMLAQADSAIPRAEIDDTGFRMMGREVALEAWRAMIDEALK